MIDLAKVYVGVWLFAIVRFSSYSILVLTSLVLSDLVLLVGTCQPSIRFKNESSSSLGFENEVMIQNMIFIFQIAHVILILLINLIISLIDYKLQKRH